MNPPTDAGGHPAATAGTSARRRPPALVEALVLVLAFTAFTVLHGAAARDVAAATAHAHALQSVERALHLDIELAANQWLVGGGTVPQVMAVYLYRSYYLVIIGVLVWVYLRHTEAYPRVRRTLLAMVVLVLPVYWAVPLSPPRFALPGAVDVVAAHDPVGGSGWTEQGDATSYTAMPSMHVAFSAWCAYAVWTALRGSHPRLAWLAWTFPLAMTAVVLTTANHYVLDIVGSAVLLAASVGTAVAWERLARRRRAAGPT